MAGRETRRIINLGKTSKAITLPLPFLDFHRLKAGDTVLLIYNNIMLIGPEELEQSLRDKVEAINQLLSTN